MQWGFRRTFSLGWFLWATRCGNPLSVLGRVLPSPAQTGCLRTTLRPDALK